MSAEYSVSAPGVSMAITTRSARLVLVAILSVIPVCGTRLQAEDVKLREQAVHLMEVASAVSLPGGYATMNTWSHSGFTKVMAR
jgi:hypothetical protein